MHRLEFKRGDGIFDAQELRAGTDPRDPPSLLRIGALGRTAEGVQVRFETAARPRPCRRRFPQRFYRLRVEQL